MSKGKLVLMSRRPTGNTPSSRTHSLDEEKEQVNRIVSPAPVQTYAIYGEKCPTRQ